MESKPFGKILGAVLFVLILLSAPLYNQAVKAAPSSAKNTGKVQILLASLQINMSVVLKQDSAGQDNQKLTNNKSIANGIGSLIEKDGEVFLVTHNHWGDVLQDVSLVELRDAQDGLLLRLFGFEFKGLIRYQDKGALILEVPDGLSAFLSEDCGGSRKQGLLIPGQPGNSQKVKPGDRVQLAYHASANRQVLAILEAEVVSIDQYKGLPIFILRSVNGQPVLQGDSGGGIWQDGKLVGNMWATLVKDTRSNASQTGGNSPGSTATYTDTSFAAILTASAMP